MRDITIILVTGLLLVFVLAPGFQGDGDPENRFSGRSSMGGTHQVDEKFGGGIKIHENDGGEVEIDPDGQSGN